jgi:hypothetical protein
MLEKNPTQILSKAVMGMLSRNNLRHHAIEPRLKIYIGPTHPHMTQLGQLAETVKEAVAVEAAGGAIAAKSQNRINHKKRPPVTATTRITQPIPVPGRKKFGNFHFGLKAYTSELGRISTNK